ncbi:MAG: type I DNA topoisomerase [Bacteroides sp.]|nr:type I DNA topoisomerase [Roseburia sp.]MCM1346461.1 type I DNA topoisomerase [Bacteroides sp.]MCM1421028.1 type I DNA topoisomerase [Bacteroides sp.]
MQKNLVIVESPAKAKTLEKFLGKDYKVMSSYGHIRDLKKKAFSINMDDFSPVYEIPSDKSELVKTLKSCAKEAETVWLASDEDREGEAISWHLAQVLGLDASVTKRIVFHEITKSAILAAIEHPRTIDLNLVNAQQARRVLDRIVGFKLSPVLWKKLKPSLSAGRVQSVAVRLIVEREREVESFVTESSYKVSAIFFVGKDGGNEATGHASGILKSELNMRFKTADEARSFLESCRDKRFVITEISKRPLRKTPAAPFTTSTLQQEAARKLGFTVSQTMMIAQKLYESGRITYMRTDSVNLSSLCLNDSRKAIVQLFGEEYANTRHFHTKSKGAQEAHEAIRPTYISDHEIEGTLQERRLYELIWKRTVASQMADAETEKTTVRIKMEGSGMNVADAEFVATGEVVTFEGFLRVYHESFDDDSEADDSNKLLPPVREGQYVGCGDIVATERFTQHPPRYTEASLVRKLEELGIGRPSTYAPTISTIQQREYVEKGDKEGEERTCTVLTLKDGKINECTKTEFVGNEKSKLLPTDIGTVVNDFLYQYFPTIMDYNFTAKVEKEFDEIADGDKEWKDVLHTFYEQFEPMVEKTLNDKTEHKVGERVLGTDPASGKEVSVKIGRFGPVVQIGSSSDEDKPRFAQLKKGQSIASITFEEAMDLFKLPRTLGEYEGKTVNVGSGRFGPYVQHDGKYVSLPKGMDPMDIDIESAVSLIEEKRKQEQERHLKCFDEEPELEILNGRYGPYIYYKGANFKLPKTVTDPKSLTVEECMDIIKAQADKPKTTRGRKKK